ncbi:hypothetical protein [Flavobacterium cellulosilyticum]|uniref:Uncharacterized protein n=1 Tax=Flavobacterium cellulosilyticum TaxID=2541731 RepID=A0A4R5CPV0_9FLAO|nr:hypothetical protein [Flavobacterium cellulosilyticum]TDD99612.1 hypothetical protein E0F76_02485 [Flavobacterium cellulosilyticum]
MNTKKYQPILETIFISVLVYLLHKVIFWLNASNSKFQDFHFSLETIYGFFLICSILIVFALIKVKDKNIDSVGFGFIWATLIKMGLSYAVLAAISESKNLNLGFEKINFFIVFALFLTIETVITIRFLNNKQ